MPHGLSNVAVPAARLLMPSLLMLSVLILSVLLGACRPQVMPAETTGTTQTPASQPVATIGPDEAVPNAVTAIDPVVIVPPAPRLPAATAFDPADVPASQATLPPFPLLPVPEPLSGLRAESQHTIAFDREHLIAGDSIIAVEGRVFRQRYLLEAGPREYSEAEFHRGYAAMIAALGGVEVSQVQFTPQVNAAFGGRAKVERYYHGVCASPACENHSYLIRQDDKQYWALVSTGGQPLQGRVTLIEREAPAAAGPPGGRAADQREAGPPAPQQRLSSG